MFLPQFLILSLLFAAASAAGPACEVMMAIGGGYESIQGCGPAEPTQVMLVCFGVMATNSTQPILKLHLEFQEYQDCVTMTLQSYVQENIPEGAATPEHAEELEACLAYAGK